MSCFGNFMFPSKELVISVSRITANGMRDARFDVPPRRSLAYSFALTSISRTRRGNLAHATGRMHPSQSELHEAEVSG